ASPSIQAGWIIGDGSQGSGVSARHPTRRARRREYSTLDRPPVAVNPPGLSPRPGAQCPPSGIGGPWPSPPDRPSAKRSPPVMAPRRRPLPTGIALAIGLAAGWGLATYRAPGLLASGGDRWGDSIVVSCPVRLRYDPLKQTQVTEDAIYYLDYAGGRLMASVA